MNRRHLHNLCALLGEDLDVERARDEYLASLDADQGLAVLLIPGDEIRRAVACSGAHRIRGYTDPGCSRPGESRL